MKYSKATKKNFLQFTTFMFHLITTLTHTVDKLVCPKHHFASVY